jgi:tight adherence protein B
LSAEGAVLQLAGLLKAGMPAELALRELVDDLAQLTPRQAGQLAAIWQLAMECGGAVSSAIESLGRVFKSTARHEREIDLAFAGPKATAKLVAWLPAAGLIMAQLFGFAPLNAIATNPLAFLSLIVGALLLVTGHRWSKSIIRKATPGEDDSGLFFDAVRFGMEAGLPLSVAIGRAAEVFEQHLDFAPAALTHAKLERISELNRSSGASISNLLAGEAAARRETQWFNESTALAKLSVKLMIPLGLITLPAFVLSTIVPVAISLLSNRQNL